jgi:lysozyme
MAEINEGVRYTQQRLNRAGFGPLNEDGIWGPRTKAAFDRAVIPPTNSAPDDVDPILFKQLARDEGCVLTAYPDPLSALAARCKAAGLNPRDYQRLPGWRTIPGDPWTIGYGHTGRDVYAGLVWTQPQADAALVADMIAHNAVLDEVLPWIASLDPPRRRVLYNMHFNMGWDNPRTPKLEGLAGFVNTLAKVKAGDYAGAAENMKKSRWYGQVGDRSKRLVATMQDGQDR